MESLTDRLKVRAHASAHISSAAAAHIQYIGTLFLTNCPTQTSSSAGALLGSESRKDSGAAEAQACGTGEESAGGHTGGRSHAGRRHIYTDGAPCRIHHAALQVQRMRLRCPDSPQLFVPACLGLPRTTGCLSYYMLPDSSMLGRCRSRTLRCCPTRRNTTLLASTCKPCRWCVCTPCIKVVLTRSSGAGCPKTHALSYAFVQVRG